MSTEAPPLRKLGLRDIIQSLVGMVVVVLVIAFGLPHLLDTSWEAILAQLSRVRIGTAVAMGVLLLAGLFCYTWVLIGSLPGLGHLQALKANAVTSTVASVIPLGVAVGLPLVWAMYRSWGFSKQAVSSSMLVTAVWNLLARITLPVIGCLTVAAGPIDAPTVVVQGAWVATILGLIVVVVCVLMIASDSIARQVSKALHLTLHPLRRWLPRRARRRRGIEAVVTEQRARIEEVVRGQWLKMALGMAGQFVLLFGLYWLVARVVGLDVTVPELICAYAFRQFLTVVAITPGGLGITEVGTAGLLVIFGGDAGAASATALLYTVYAHLLVVPFGVTALASWRLRAKQEPAAE